MLNFLQKIVSLENPVGIYFCGHWTLAYSFNLKNSVEVAYGQFTQILLNVSIQILDWAYAHI